MAALWLEVRGFTILEKNWRIGHLEIDLIATKAEWLHIIEVKTRSSATWGGPELSVDPKKFNRLRNAAHIYLSSKRRFRWIQFDILAITVAKNQKTTIEYFEDVYY